MLRQPRLLLCLAGIAAGLALVPAPAALAETGLAGQWHFDSYSGSGDSYQTPDSSGNGLFGSTSPSPPILVPGRFGQAIDFAAGVNSQVFFPTTTPGFAGLEPTATITVAAWVKRSGFPGYLQYVVSKGADSVCNGSPWAIYTGYGIPNRGLQFYVRTTKAFVISPRAGEDIWDGAWHAVAGTYDGTTVRFYVDGKEVGGGAAGSGDIDYTLQTRTPTAEIGAYPDNSCGPSKFAGQVDEVRVYKRALNATEIARLQDPAATQPPEVDLPVITPPVVTPPPPTAVRAVEPRFVIAANSKLKGTIWLNGAVSDPPPDVRINRFSWDFNADGKTDADCSGNAPAAVTKFSKAGTYPVILKTLDSLGRTASVKQDLTVTKNQVNQVPGSFFMCLEPANSAANQPDRKDCVKTFSFGIIEVNGRGRSSQCFEVTSRPALSERVAGASQIDKVSLIRDYHAKIAGDIALNGIPIPVPGNRITEYDSGKQTISIGTQSLTIPLPAGVVLKVPDVDLAYKITPVKGVFKLPPLKTGGTSIGKLFGGLKIGGGIEVELRNRSANVTITLKLPDVFSVGFKREAEGSVKLHTTNATGFQFDGLKISQIPQVFLGPLYVTNLFFDYTRTGEIWSGGANFQLAAVSPVEIKASPPPPDYGFGLRAGRFDHAGGGVAFPYPPRPQIFPGVGLTEIGGAIGIDPIRFTGRMGIDVGGLFVIDGSAFIGLASEDDPYDFPDEFAPPGLEFLAGRTLDTVSIAIGGQAKIQVPVVGELPLINSYVFYGFPDYAEFGGGFKYSVADRIGVDGNVGGFIAIGAHKFNLEGQVQACVDIEVTSFCLKVAAVISTTGIGFCAVVPVPIPVVGGTVPVQVGVGYRWGGSVEPHLFSCDLGPYKEARPAARGAQAGQGFEVGKGLPSAMVRIRGRDGVPSVVLSGPGGRKLAVGGAEVGAVSKDVVAIAQADAKTLLVGLKAPVAGHWTVSARPGSAAIASVAEADGLDPPRVKANVSGRGSRRVLTYSIAAAAGQRVTFIERGARTWRVLGEARGLNGRLPFEPALGRAGKRTIEALVERGGVSNERLKVASFAVGRAPKPVAPRGLRVRRTRGGLAIGWRRVPGAARYVVTVEASGRARILRVTRRTALVVKGLDRRARGTVRVGALRLDGVGGREAARPIPRR